MLVFSSLSVSSYDAASLADRLTEKSAEGWDVVAIVPAGTNVTAYLSRAAERAEPEATGSEAPAARVAAPEVRVPESVAAEAALAGAGTTTAAADTTVPDVEPAPATEPAGWGTEPATTAPSSESTSWSGDSATDAVTTSEAGVDVAPAEAAPAAMSSAADTSTTAAATQQQTDAAAMAPAGWYADPAQRYELRYWDGTQWTEHVSRAGQQYTDPPVA